MGACPSQRRARVDGGFTLAELVMVLVVLVILTGLAVPSLLGLDGSRRDVAVARTRSVLVHAQMWALSTGATTWVAFDTSNDRITAFVEDPLNPGQANRLPLPDPLAGGALILQLGHAGVGLDSIDFGGSVEVMFDSRGVPFDEGGAPLTMDGLVTITGGETIRVIKNTGLIAID